MNRCLVSLPLVLACAGLPGCLINSGSRVSYSGNYISPRQMEHIVPGRTSEREAVEILGPPSRTANKDDGTKLLWWTYSKQESKDTSVFLLLNSDDSRKFQESVLLCVKDGVVSDMRTE